MSAQGGQETGHASRPPLWRLLRWAGLSVLGAACVLTGCDNGGTYVLKSGRWHFEGRLMEVADPASFQPLGRHFARDKLRGYYRHAEVTDSDGASFDALSENVARDKRRVWWADTYRKGQEYWLVQHLRITVIVGADPASYQSLRDGYGRDKGSAFHEDRAFKVRHPASFEVLGQGFTRDAQRAYFERREIAGSDGASFALIDPRDGRYARDRQRVYHAVPEMPRSDGNGLMPPRVQPLQGATPAGTQVLGRGYARDGARVWWAGQPVAGVEATSFAVEEDVTLQHDAHDARARYRQGVQLPSGAP